MTDPRDRLAAKLAATRPEEVDCGTFIQQIAAYVDGRPLGEAEALFEHHRRICPECEQELEALRRALAG